MDQCFHFRLNLIDVIDRLAYECSIDPETVNYCKTRLKNEGLKFLTVTLPKLSKAIIVSLEEGFFIRPSSFAWKGNLLRHFEILSNIFDKQGVILANCDALAIMQVRQFCEYFYKLVLEFDEAALLEAENKFLAHDKTVPSVGEYDIRFCDQLRKDFESHYRYISSAHVHEILRATPPRSGSGSYSGVRPSEYGSAWFTRRVYDVGSPRKWRQFAYSRRETLYSPCPSWADELDVSEVLFVPKDSRGPRTIVREPFLSLGYQMSYFDFLSKNLEYYSRHRINFQDQSRNQRLACASSVTREYATLDLKDASDSVSYAIIRHIFRYSNGLLSFVLNRTDTTQLPSGKRVTLRKLSGMGSGLTFPTMALLIHLAITRAIVDNTGLSYNFVRGVVYVYGDDIIVPRKYYQLAVSALTRVGLHVNLDKSFHKGLFRESCGGDYYNGQDVSFVRCKLPNSEKFYSNGVLHVKGSSSLLEMDAHAAELVKHGICQLSDYYYSLIERKVGPLPTKTGDVPFIARYSRNMPASYFGSCTLYKKIKCIQIVPRTYVVLDREEYFLSARLRDSKPLSWKDTILNTSRDHSRLSIPRKIGYRCVSVNPLTLT